LVLNINIVVIDSLLELDGTSSELIFPPVGEIFSIVLTILLSESTTDAPNACENEYLLKSGSLDFSGVHNRCDELANRDNHGNLYLRDDVLHEFSTVVKSLRQVSLEFLSELFLGLGIATYTGNPRFDVGSPLVTIGVRDVKNTCSGYSSWGSESQVTNFEDHLHVTLERDTLIGGKSEQLVVIHDRVHGLNPGGIEITIKDNPLGKLVLDLTKSSHGIRQNTIFPLTSGHLDVTIKLISVCYLRVDVLEDGLLSNLGLSVSESLPSG
jgi:hypothetical protein